MGTKLIRDKLADIPREGVTVFQTDLIGHRLGLALKMHEEVSEIMNEPWDVMEYADLLTAMQAFANLHGVKWRHITRAARRKFQERGGFLRGKAIVRV